MANWPLTLNPGDTVTQAHYNSIVTGLYNYPVGADPVNCNGVTFQNVGAFNISGAFGATALNIVNTSGASAAQIKLEGPGGIKKFIRVNTSANALEILNSAGSAVIGSIAEAGGISTSAAAALSSTSGTFQTLFSATATTGNTDQMRLIAYRTSTGSTWASAAWIFQRLVDGVLKSSITFNGSSQITLGAAIIADCSDSQLTTGSHVSINSTGKSAYRVLQVSADNPSTGVDWTSSSAGAGMLGIGSGPAQTDINMLMGVNATNPTLGSGWIQVIKASDRAYPLYIQPNGGGLTLGTPTSQVSDTNLAANNTSIWYDESTNRLYFRYRRTDNAVKTGYVQLS